MYLPPAQYNESNASIAEKQFNKLKNEHSWRSDCTCTCVKRTGLRESVLVQRVKIRDKSDIPGGCHRANANVKYAITSGDCSSSIFNVTLWVKTKAQVFQFLDEVYLPESYYPACYESTMYSLKTIALTDVFSSMKKRSTFVESMTLSGFSSFGGKNTVAARYNCQF